MAILHYKTEQWKWMKAEKEDVLQKEDIEGNTPCELCWEDARENGVYAGPLNVPPEKFKRCKCGRMIGIIGINP